LLEDLQTRVVIPLTKASSLAKNPLTQLTPIIELEGEPYILVTPQLAGISRIEFGAAIGSLVKKRDAILAAMYFLSRGFDCGAARVNHL
jgi:toxin CcdB